MYPLIYTGLSHNVSLWEKICLGPIRIMWHCNYMVWPLYQICFTAQRTVHPVLFVRPWVSQSKKYKRQSLMMLWSSVGSWEELSSLLNNQLLWDRITSMFIVQDIFTGSWVSSSPEQIDPVIKIGKKKLKKAVSRNKTVFLWRCSANTAHPVGLLV